jgi:hypothetical protein
LHLLSSNPETFKPKALGYTVHADLDSCGRIRRADVHPRPSAAACSCDQAGAVVRVDLSSCSATLIVGRIGDRDVKRAELLVAENQRYLSDEWERLHGSRQSDSGGS